MRRPRARIPFLLLLLAATPAGAQQIVTSARPERVSVTVYRDPERFPHSPPNPEWLNGYALISETRQISVPAGESTIRFEGVAGGIVPETAIVTGFREGLIERNRDASLLSAASLLDNNLGRRVHLRRTSRATGEVREQEAVIRSSPDGAVVLQTAEGFEALRCTGQNETLVYPGVPEGLAARPTLSVRIRAAQAATATVTLSYLATGFDWQANYIARLTPDGHHVDLFAWLTLVNGDETSFPDAEALAVAGHVNREQRRDYVEEPETSLSLRCWPQGSTSDPQGQEPGSPGRRMRSRFGATEGFVGGGADEEQAVMVTGTRIVYREELGDLKLFRVPEPVTVAAHSQKQVALLDQPGVRVDTVYRMRIGMRYDFEFEPANLVLVTRNRREEGLGLPLPAGAVVLFDGPSERPILVGQGSIRDLAVGEDVEILAGPATGVMVEVAFDDETDEAGDHYVLTVSNDRAVPVRFEAEFQVEEEEVFTPRQRLRRRNGMPIWSVTVPAHGRASTRYRVDDRPEPRESPGSAES
jgi:hypothetical protein